MVGFSRWTWTLSESSKAVRGADSFSIPGAAGHTNSLTARPDLRCLTPNARPFTRCGQGLLTNKTRLPMTTPAAADAFIAAAGLSVRMRQAIDLIVENGALQRLWATEACADNPYQPNLVWAPSIFGTPLELDLREEVCAAIFTYGVFDAPLLAFLSRTLGEGDVFFDVGAHIGFFTVAASTLVGETGQVVSFEPMPETFNRLTVNARNTGRSNITLVNAAAWNEEAVLQFRDFGPSASAFNSVFESRKSRNGDDVAEKIIEVNAVRLDDYVARNAVRPSVMKIDVESAESQVVSGLHEVLSAADRPVLVVEVGDFEHLAAAGVPSSAELLNRIKAYGYGLYDIAADGHIVPHTLIDGPYSYMNLACIPIARDEPDDSL
ncbi:MAG: FkbM family methyltransferase [Caulobacteraceae bacterium]|nr:FkbM family methyltransferase [Caulobacteraceae bacterium]